MKVNYINVVLLKSWANWAQFTLIYFRRPAQNKQLTRNNYETFSYIVMLIYLPLSFASYHGSDGSSGDSSGGSSGGGVMQAAQEMQLL